MNVHVLNLGCAKNRVDGEVLMGILESAGHTLVDDPAQAELIVVNTCGFIESAKQESIDALFEMNEYRKTGKLKTLVASGCLAQRYHDELMAEMPELDGIMGVADYARALEALSDAQKGLRPMCVADGERFLHEPRRLTTPPYSAYVKISDGCDNRCAYCAIPLIRGPYRSRPMEDILEECRDLASHGVTELTLIAQDTSRYGSDFPGRPLLLPDLLRQIHEIPGIHWIRVLYCYPDTCTDELLETVASLPKVAPYLDLPLQHINARLLKAMNRRGTPEDIRALIQKCRKLGLLIRTTMIVGFPGETEEEFRELLDFVEETRFDRLGAFTYSPEEGTRAAEMPGQIDEDVKQDRLDRLMGLQQAISARIGQARVGTDCEALLERQEGGDWIARSLLEAPDADGVIRVQTLKPHRCGEYIRVHITGSSEYDLYGEEIQA